MSFDIPVTIYYGDTDAGGMVYHANYLHYMERCRSDFLNMLGWDVTRIEREFGLVFIIRSIKVNYMQPARLSDKLRVTLELTRLGHASLRVHQQVLRGDTEVCAADIELAMVDTSGFSPARIPKTIANEIRAWKQK